ncbi:hypothetical protein HCN44_007265 [Aphidius gifuensis]|uniref:Uncharacterized protein n=1 Tax=Aphidius gifuensis TaxID=684658 RepID=A0A835CQA0_APHGI|nr:hypothetical protein HCN44_007265 [Aphidius gifuensis]
MCETLIPASEIEKNRVYLDLEVNLWTEYSWTHNKLNPAAYTGEDRSKFELADSWPDHIPKFKDTKKSCLLSQMQRKISQESDMDESDSDKKAYEDSLINVSGISIKKYEHRIFNSTLEPTQSEREERRVLSNLGSGFLAELLWIDENLNPNLCTGEKKEKLKLAESWPNSVPNFEDIIKSCRLSQMQRKISQESDMDESDSDENAYEDSLINVSGISLE